MKYKNKYDVIEAKVYNGHNLKELNDFCEGRLSWKSEELEWSEMNPPEDLIIQFNDEKINDILIPGAFVVKFDDGHFGIIDGYDFVRLFEEVKDGE